MASVADIASVECLDDIQAKDALAQFKELGWYDTMIEEIQAVGGNVSALENLNSAPNVLNVRFRIENVVISAPESYAAVGDPIL